MKKPNKALLKQTCETGDDVKFVDLFNKLSPGDKQSAIEEDNYLIFHLAVANGNAQIANFILEYVQKSTDLIPQEEAVIPLLKSRNHESFVIALENDHREVVDLLLSQDFFFNPCVIIISQNPNLYHKLFSLNLQNLAKYIFSYTCGLNLKNLKALLEVTPAECRQTILENTRTRLQVVSNVYAVDEPGFVKACTSRKADIVEFLWNLYHDEFKNLLKDKFFALCIQEVAKNGEVSIFNFLISQLNPEEKRGFCGRTDKSGRFLNYL